MQQFQILGVFLCSMFPAVRAVRGVADWRVMKSPAQDLWPGYTHTHTQARAHSGQAPDTFDRRSSWSSPARGGLGSLAPLPCLPWPVVAVDLGRLSFVSSGP